MEHTVYILKCCDGSLYTGYTNNLDKRLKTHSEGKGSKYVRSKAPFTLVHTERFVSKSEAMKREAEIKSLTRQQKMKLLNPPALEQFESKSKASIL